MIHVITDHPIACDSNDHKYPRGTMQDNSVNTAFNNVVRQLFGDVCSVLDLGCAGGGMVRSFIDRGHVAVGIEGSDFSQRFMRAEWAELNGTNLCTADITKPFQIVGWSDDDDGKPEKLVSWLTFDVITMWEVLEHIAEDDLPQLFENIDIHLKKNGVVVMSVSPNEDVNWGVTPPAHYHQCVHDLAWWES